MDAWLSDPERRDSCCSSRPGVEFEISVLEANRGSRVEGFKESSSSLPDSGITSSSSDISYLPREASTIEYVVLRPGIDGLAGGCLTALTFRAFDGVS